MKQYLETGRLILRGWKEEDIEHLAILNGDDKVMEYFLKPLSYEETIARYNQIQEEFIAHGYGAYAVEEKGTSAFIGFVGFHNVTFEVDFAPAVEILWRLLPEFWALPLRWKRKRNNSVPSLKRVKQSKCYRQSL